MSEDVYDNEISPLIAEIITICKRDKMPMFASFEYSEGDFCTTSMPFDGHPIFAYHEALRQCTEDGGINIDKLMFWIMAGARERGHSSLILSQLGISTEPPTQE